MSAFLIEWAALLTRWLHFTAGVAWVGASFYFIWVENALERGGRGPDGKIAGHLWAVHGGGFYYLEKYVTGPDKLPPRLHWFKWEAYTTWLTGMMLMVLVYYAHGFSLLLSAGSPLSAGQGVALSLASLVAGLAVYLALCATALLRMPVLLSLAGLALTLLAAWGLGHVFSPRAVYLHVGAMIGTIMAANVIMVIIPAQKRLVASVSGKGPPPDPATVERGALRSLHNNYLTLPVLFTMISNHYAVVYQSPNSLLALAAILVGSVLLRHAFNIHNRADAAFPVKISVYASAATIFLLLSAIATVPNIAAFSDGKADFAQVREVIGTHCALCHSRTPTQPGFSSAPLGMLLDTDEQIRAQIEAIHLKAFIDRSMPPGNLTGMTDEQRALLARWYAQQKLEE